MSIDKSIQNINNESTTKEQYKPYKKGDTLNIYTDYIYDKKYEGCAMLLKRIEKGHSFIIPEEKLYTKLEDRAINTEGNHSALSKEQKNNNKKWTTLNELFTRTELKALEAKLIKKLNKKVDNYDILNNYLIKIRFQFINSTSPIRALFMDYTNDDIIRYVQQKHLKNWTYTVYRMEKWLVEFVPEQYDTTSKWCLFSKPFRTTRKIKRIVCICPDENSQNCEMIHHTTDESGRSNADRAELKERLKQLEYEKRV